jgi:chromosome segregation ATPase
MPWRCIHCGWENEQDERIGFEEPSCIRCGRERVDFNTFMTHLTEEIATLQREQKQLVTQLRNKQEHHEYLQSEIGNLESEMTELMEHHRWYNHQIEDLRNQQSTAITNYTGKRQMASDQFKLTEFTVSER